MNCRSCGTPVGTQQQFCPNCGAAVNSSGMPNNVNMPSMQGVNSVPNFSNIQEPTGIGFNRNMENDLAEFGANNPYANRSDFETKQPTNNSGMYVGNMKLPDDGSKKKFPWFILAGALVVVMFLGIAVLPHFNKLNVKVYEDDLYSMEYNANWYVDEEKEDMTLYYSDKNSRLIFNALSSFTALNGTVSNESGKKDLYQQFYNAWSKIDGGNLTGGTNTFLPLGSGSLYARVDYVMTGRSNVGSFYVVINEEHDKVISFMTYCTTANKEDIDKDVMDMLESISYKKEAERSVYDEFKAGEVKEYSALGYMSYDIPSCWKYDDARSKENQYKSNIFVFMDEVTLMDIKSFTPYNSVNHTFGTSYESMKASIVKAYGAVKTESKKTIKGKVWYVVTTPDYNVNGYSYHNEIYFTMSATNQHLYYVEVYVNNDTSPKKTKYLNKSIEYVLESATLLKVNE